MGLIPKVNWRAILNILAEKDVAGLDVAMDDEAVDRVQLQDT